MKRPRYLQEEELLLLSKEQLDGYFHKWYVYLFVDVYTQLNAPMWLYQLTSAYRSGETEEIVGTPLMTTFRQLYKKRFTR